MEKQCLRCGKPFTPKRNTKKFCSETCKQYAYLIRHGLSIQSFDGIYVNDGKKISINNDNKNSIVNDLITVKEKNIPVIDVKIKPIAKINTNVNREENIVFERPQIIQLIEYHLNHQYHLNTMVGHPDSLWNEKEALLIKWVNMRLKCILHNLIKLSYKEKVFSETICAIAEALSKMVGSTYFKMLPNNYPYKIFIEHLAGKIQALKKQAFQCGEIKLSLSQEKKAEYIVMLYNLSNLTPLRKFSELAFE